MFVSALILSSSSRGKQSAIKTKSLSCIEINPEQSNTFRLFLILLFNANALKPCRGDFYIPDDCWELIFNRLEEDVLDLAAVSLVSKRFLSITNRLEEVTISGYVTDDGVEALASKLKELKKIVFQEGSYCYTDRSLVSLSSNCLKLSEIHLIDKKPLVIREGNGFVMQHSPNLTSLALMSGSTVCLRGSVVYEYESSITCSRKLHTLSIEEDSSKLLSCIAKARPLLKKLKLYDNRCRGLSSLLQSCRSTL
ncbi:hypothetical protein C3L33_05683, partial [Rhododendron williamsianum]